MENNSGPNSNEEKEIAKRPGWRLDPSVIELVDRYANEQSKSGSTAVTELIRAAIESKESGYWELDSEGKIQLVLTSKKNKSAAQNDDQKRPLEPETDQPSNPSLSDQILSQKDKDKIDDLQVRLSRLSYALSKIKVEHVQAVLSQQEEIIQAIGKEVEGLGISLELLRGKSEAVVLEGKALKIASLSYAEEVKKLSEISEKKVSLMKLGAMSAVVTLSLVIFLSSIVYVHFISPDLRLAKVDELLAERFDKKLDSIVIGQDQKLQKYLLEETNRLASFQKQYRDQIVELRTRLSDAEMSAQIWHNKAQVNDNKKSGCGVVGSASTSGAFSILFLPFFVILIRRLGGKKW